jgi:hypothetical protein
LISTLGLANQGEYEWFRHAHDREGNLCISGGIYGAIDPDDAYTEQLAWHSGEGRIVFGILAVIV